MQNNDNPADPFKKALAEATKVMADDAELSVTYSWIRQALPTTPFGCLRSAGG
jgi:cobalamin biosynthesis protein CobT